MKNSKKISQLITFLIGVVLLIGLDQFTKYLMEAKLKGNYPIVVVKGVFEFSYLQNTGAAWGIFSGGRTLLIIFTIFILAFITFIVIKTPTEKKYFPLRCVLVLIYAGACGNFIDRVVFSYVRDFFYFKLIDFPIFNVADIYVTVAMVLVIILVFFFYKDDDFDFLSPKKPKKEMEIK